LRSRILTLPYKLKFSRSKDRKHFNLSLSEGKSSVSEATFKWIVRCKSNISGSVFTMSNGGSRHSEYKVRVISRADVMYVHDYALENCSLRDYLMIRLPMKAGLRTNEICTLRIEKIDFESCNFEVLDSKKYCFYPLPLDMKSVDLIRKLVAPRTEGYVFRQLTSWKEARADEPLHKVTVWVRVKNIGKAAGVEGFKPRILRDFFAAHWHYVKKGNLETLRQIMRHESIEVTGHYVASMVFKEDIEQEYRANVDEVASRFGVANTMCSVCRECPAVVVCKFASQMPEFATGCSHKSRIEVVTKFGKKKVSEVSEF